MSLDESVSEDVSEQSSLYHVLEAGPKPTVLMLHQLLDYSSSLLELPAHHLVLSCRSIISGSRDAKTFLSSNLCQASTQRWMCNAQVKLLLMDRVQSVAAFVHTRQLPIK